MKMTTMLAAVHLAACSFAVEVPVLPPSEFADTEVSTNFAFAVDAVANRRLGFSLELQASPSNNMESPQGDALLPELNRFSGSKPSGIC